MVVVDHSFKWYIFFHISDGYICGEKATGFDSVVLVGHVLISAILPFTSSLCMRTHIHLKERCSTGGSSTSQSRFSEVWAVASRRGSNQKSVPSLPCPNRSIIRSNSTVVSDSNKMWFSQLILIRGSVFSLFLILWNAISALYQCAFFSYSSPFLIHPHHLTFAFEP